MKKLILISCIVFCTSCAVKQIGKVNMISDRNVNKSANYQLLSSYENGSKSSLRKNRAKTIEAAVDNVVEKVPGGDYLMNAKIYRVGAKLFAVDGDVWGVKAQAGTFRGFKIGDKVTWKVALTDKFETGTIVARKDNKSCIIKTKGGKQIVKNYDKISKLK